MSESTPEIIEQALASFFSLLTIAGAWFLQHFRETTPGRSFGYQRRNAQSTIQSRKANALPHRDTYNELETAQQGEQEYEEGRFTAAKLSSAAADFFGRAARKPQKPRTPNGTGRG